MNRQPVVTRLQFITGLALIGIGHLILTLSGVRGWLGAVGLYALGLGVWTRLWFSSRRARDAIQQALSGAWRVTTSMWRDAWRFWRSTLRTLWPLTSRETRLKVVIGLNAVLVSLAIVLPEIGWLWLIGSAATLLILRRAAPAPGAQPIERPTARATFRWQPPLWGLIGALSLLIVGHSLISSNPPYPLPVDASLLALTISDALHLELPIDPTVALGGLALLLLGVLLFARIARQGVLSDQVDDLPASPLLLRLTPVPSPENEKRFDLGRAPRAGGFARGRGSKMPRASGGVKRSNALLLVAALICWGFVIQSIVDGATGWTGVLPWLIALSLSGVYWWRTDRQRGIRLGLRIERREVVLLGLAIIALLLILSYQLGDVPASIGGDEGEFFATARGLAFENPAYDFFGMGVYTFPIPGSLYQSVWLQLLGVNIWAWRFGSVFAAVLGMIPVYFLARATLGRRVAWLSLALFVALPYTLKYARMGYNNTQSILPVSLTLLLIWLAVRRDSRWFSFLAGCAAGLGFLVYSGGKLGAVLGAGLLGWWWITRQLRGRTALTLGAVFLSGLVLVAGPSTVYGVTRYPDYFSYKSTESLINNTYYGRSFYSEQELFAMHPPIPVGGQVLFFEPGIYATLVARGLVRTTLGLHVPALNDEYYMVGALADPIGILYLIGVGWCLTRLRRANYALWLGWLWAGGFFLSVLSSFPPRGAHLVPVIPALAVLGALGLVALVDAVAALLLSLTPRPPLLTTAVSSSGEGPGVRHRVDRLKFPALVAGAAVCAVLGWQAYFVAMPQRFPPTWDNIIFWQMQQLPRGTMFVLIQPDGVADDYEPWKTLRIDTGQTFQLVKLDELPTVHWEALCSQRCRIFFMADIHDRVTPQLEQALGPGKVVAYIDVQSAPQAYSFEPVRAGP